MNEAFPVNQFHQEHLEAMQPFVESMLHGEQTEIDASKPLMGRDEAVEMWGINGDILATITLPGEPESKEIAIVDYGEPDVVNPRPITIFEGQPIRTFGVARQRYGLHSLNYVPESHMATHVGFEEGASVELGRDLTDRTGNNDANYKLGLGDNEKGNTLISRHHATVTIEGDKITVADHSTNGSLVRFANPERTETLSELRDIHQYAGHSAVNGAEANASQTAASPENDEQSIVDKYTEAFVKEYPFDHMIDPELSDEQRDEVLKRIGSMDLRSDERKRSDAEQAARSVEAQQRTTVDSRYNLARQAGASHDAASASADRAYAKTYDELLAEELKRVGL